MIDGFLWGIVRARAGTEETAAVILQQALNCGKIDGDSARSLCEQAPRFVSMLIDGLTPAYGKMDFRRFIEYAERGLITRSAIHTAMR